VAVPVEPGDEHRLPAAVRRALRDAPVHLPDRQAAEPEIRRQPARPLAGVDRRGDVVGIRAEPGDERLQSVPSDRPTAGRHVRLLRDHVVRLRDPTGIDSRFDPVETNFPRIPVDRIVREPRLDAVAPLPSGVRLVTNQPVAADELDADRLPGALVAGDAVPPARSPLCVHLPAGVAEALQNRDRVAVGVGQSRAAHVAVLPVEVPETVMEELDPGVAGGPVVSVERRIEDEQRENPASVAPLPPAAAARAGLSAIRRSVRCHTTAPVDRSSIDGTVSRVGRVESGGCSIRTSLRCVETRDCRRLRSRAWIGGTTRRYRIEGRRCGVPSAIGSPSPEPSPCRRRSWRRCRRPARAPRRARDDPRGSRRRRSRPRTQ